MAWKCQVCDGMEDKGNFHTGSGIRVLVRNMGYGLQEELEEKRGPRDGGYCYTCLEGTKRKLRKASGSMTIQMVPPHQVLVVVPGVTNTRTRGTVKEHCVLTKPMILEMKVSSRAAI